MADNNRIKSIALVGASGNIGSSILHALITSSHSYHITIITRSDSTSTFSKFPPSKSTITIKQGSYADPAFLSTAFQGADAAIFALHFMAMGVQGQMIEAAAKVGVKWILPTEYAGDGLNESMVEAVPLFHPKREARRQIEELSKKYEGLRWIGVATGPWLEASIQRSLFALNPHSRTATLYPDAGPFNTVTLSYAGLAIAGLLALPLINPSNPRASLSHYANNFLYTSSFHTTQERIFESLQRATGTQEEDWKVDRSKTIEEWAGVCREGMKKGDMRMGAGLTFAYYMGEGWGGDVETKAKEDREVLGLTEEEEDFDEAVKRAVEAGEPAPLNFGK